MERVFGVSIVACLALLVLLLLCSTAATAQSLADTQTTAVKVRKPKRPPIDWNVKAVSPLIDQQAQRLWRIYDKYERDEVPRLLWVDEKLWYDLFADRRYLAGSVDYVFRKNTVRTIWMSQDRMERELLMQMVTPQISFIAEELELSETQVDRLALLVNQDVYKKHQLLRTTFNDLDPDQFFVRLRAVTTSTEEKIKKILFSDQLTYYRRLSTEAFEQKSTKIASVGTTVQVQTGAD